MSTPKNEEVTKQSQLIRTVEAALKVAIPDADEIAFRSSLLACATAKIPDLGPGFIVRLYEAACDVKFPTDHVGDFRKSLQRAIGKNLDLRSYRKANPPTAQRGNQP